MADFLTIFGNSDYNYGTTPSLPVAEQNQTYFAYWNGIGGTGPEYIDGTGYFIKYLIDINGNVVNPEPYNETTSIEAVPLHNLKANFEVGKRAIVKLVEPDPTQNVAPSTNTLKGTHRIAHVGKIVPIMVTETGPNVQDYITTMSFGPLTTQTLSTTVNGTVPFVSQQFRYTGNEYELGGGGSQNPPYESIDFDFPLNPVSIAWIGVSNSEKQIYSSSLQTGTRIRMKVNLFLEETWGNNNENTVYIRIIRNGDENDIVSCWPNWDPEGNPPNRTTDGRDWTYMFGPISPNYAEGQNSEIRDGEGGEYTSRWSYWFDYNENDTFTVQAKVQEDWNNYVIKVKGTAGGRNNSVWRIEQETPPGVATESTIVSLINNYNIATSSYFTSISNYPSNNNGGYSVLTTSTDLARIWYKTAPQNLDPSSSAFNFSPITIPFSDTKPGDFIRFEYNKNQTYTIFNINQVTSSINNDIALEFYVTPSLSSISGSVAANDFYLELNHFVIYRVLNDGLYITLDVTPDWGPGGNAYTGLLLPEFASQELAEKLETLIQDLTDKEIIQ
jgi:hypothetical protein